VSCPLCLLPIADSTDVAALLNELRASDYVPSPERLETSASTREALTRKPHDPVIAFSHRPAFSVEEALSSLCETRSDVPLVVI
jgi:hypothetical protein